MESQELQKEEVVERCRDCDQPIGNGDHENGQCGHKKRLLDAVLRANGAVNVWA